MHIMLLTVDFGVNHAISPVNIFDSQETTSHIISSSTAWETSYSLVCSTLLVTPIPLPSDIPTPIFQWFYGSHGNSALPSGVTPSNTTSRMSINPNGTTYTSTLHFPRLSQCLHTGTYTCKIGAGSLANRTLVSVNWTQGIIL